MLVTFLKDDTISHGPQKVVKGQTLELPESVAVELIQAGIAEKLVDAKPSTPTMIQPELPIGGGYIVPEPAATELKKLMPKPLPPPRSRKV